MGRLNIHYLVLLFHLTFTPALVVSQSAVTDSLHTSMDSVTSKYQSAVVSLTPSSALLTSQELSKVTESEHRTESYYSLFPSTKTIVPAQTGVSSATNNGLTPTSSFSITLSSMPSSVVAAIFASSSSSDNEFTPMLPSITASASVHSSNTMFSVPVPPRVDSSVVMTSAPRTSVMKTATISSPLEMDKSLTMFNIESASIDARTATGTYSLDTSILPSQTLPLHNTLKSSYVSSSVVFISPIVSDRSSVVSIVSPFIDGGSTSTSVISPSSVKAYVTSSFIDTPVGFNSGMNVYSSQSISDSSSSAEVPLTPDFGSSGLVRDSAISLLLDSTTVQGTYLSTSYQTVTPLLASSVGSPSPDVSTTYVPYSTTGYVPTDFSTVKTLLSPSNTVSKAISEDSSVKTSTSQFKISDTLLVSNTANLQPSMFSTKLSSSAYSSSFEALDTGFPSKILTKVSSGSYPSISDVTGTSTRTVVPSVVTSMYPSISPVLDTTINISNSMPYSISSSYINPVSSLAGTASYSLKPSQEAPLIEKTILSSTPDAETLMYTSNDVSNTVFIKSTALALNNTSKVSVDSTMASRFPYESQSVISFLTSSYQPTAVLLTSGSSSVVPSMTMHPVSDSLTTSYSISMPQTPSVQSSSLAEMANGTLVSMTPTFSLHETSSALTTVDGLYSLITGLTNGIQNSMITGSFTTTNFTEGLISPSMTSPQLVTDSRLLYSTNNFINTTSSNSPSTAIDMTVSVEPTLSSVFDTNDIYSSASVTGAELLSSRTLPLESWTPTPSLSTAALDNSTTTPPQISPTSVDIVSSFDMKATMTAINITASPHATNSTAPLLPSSSIVISSSGGMGTSNRTPSIGTSIVADMSTNRTLEVVTSTGQLTSTPAPVFSTLAPSLSTESIGKHSNFSSLQTLEISPSLILMNVSNEMNTFVTSSILNSNITLSSALETSLMYSPTLSTLSRGTTSINNVLSTYFTDSFSQHALLNSTSVASTTALHYTTEKTYNELSISMPSMSDSFFTTTTNIFVHESSASQTLSVVEETSFEPDITTKLTSKDEMSSNIISSSIFSSEASIFQTPVESLTPILTSPTVLASSFTGSMTASKFLTEIPSATTSYLSTLSNEAQSSYIPMVSTLSPTPSSSMIDSISLNGTVTPSASINSTATYMMSSTVNMSSDRNVTATPFIMKSTMEAISPTTVLPTANVNITQHILETSVNISTSSVSFTTAIPLINITVSSAIMNSSVVPSINATCTATINESVSMTMTANVTINVTDMNVTESTTVMETTTETSTEPPTTTELETTTTTEPTTTTPSFIALYWLKTAIKVPMTENVTDPAFQSKIEPRLAQLYDMAVEREKAIAAGTFVDQKRRRKRYAESGNVAVNIQSIDRTFNSSEVTVVYTAENNGTNVTASTAAKTFNVLSDQEMAIQLQYVVLNKPQPFVQETPTTEVTTTGQIIPNVEVIQEQSSQLWIIGVVLGAVVLIILGVWVGLCIVSKSKKAKDTDTTAAEPKLTNIKSPPGSEQGSQDLQGSKKGSGDIAEKGTSGHKVQSPKKQSYEINTDNASLEEETNLYARVKKAKKSDLGNGTYKSLRSPDDAQSGVTNDSMANMSDDTELIESPKKHRKGDKHKHKKKKKGQFDDLYDEGSNGVMSKSMHQTTLPESLLLPQHPTALDAYYSAEEEGAIYRRIEDERRRNKQRIRDKRKKEKSFRGLFSGRKKKNTTTEELREYLANKEKIDAEIDVVLEAPKGDDELPEVFVHKKNKSSPTKGKQKQSETNEAFTPEETLKEARSRMHQLLDDAFSLISPSATSIVAQNEDEGFHSPRTQSPKSQIKLLNERNKVYPIDPETSSGGGRGTTPETESSSSLGDQDEIRSLEDQKKHEPMYVKSSSKDRGLTTWSPYRAADEVALISLPTKMQTMVGRADSAKRGKRPAAVFSEKPRQPKISNNNQLAMDPPKPIVLRTRDLMATREREATMQKSLNSTVPNGVGGQDLSQRRRNHLNSTDIKQSLGVHSSDKTNRRHSAADSAIEMNDLNGDLKKNRIKKHREPHRQTPIGEDETDVVVKSIAAGETPDQTLQSIRDELSSIVNVRSNNRGGYSRLNQSGRNSMADIA